MGHSFRHAPRDVSRRSIFGHTDFQAELGPSAGEFIAVATSAEYAAEDLDDNAPISEGVSSVDGRKLGSLWESDMDESTDGRPD